MLKPTGLVAPTVLLVALALAFAVAIPTAGPARARADCLATPNSQSPPGSHWYYHIDRAKGLKCWYVGPQDRKFQGQLEQGTAPRVQPTQEWLAPLKSATDRSTVPMQVEQPTPTQPAAGDVAQAGASAAAPTVEREEVAAKALAEQERPTRPRVAVAAQMVDRVLITPVRMLVLAVGALAVGGILLHPIFERAPARRRSGRQSKADLTVVIAAARRAAPPFPPPYSPSDYAGARARSDEKPNAPDAEPRHLIEDVEDALMGVLRDWERPAASAKSTG